MYAERWEKGFQDDCGMDADAFVENALQEIYPPQGHFWMGVVGAHVKTAKFSISDKYYC